MYITDIHIHTHTHFIHHKYKYKYIYKYKYKYTTFLDRITPTVIKGKGRNLILHGQ